MLEIIDSIRKYNYWSRKSVDLRYPRTFASLSGDRADINNPIPMISKDAIYVFEFKLNGSVADALKQIDDKGYLIPYTADGRRLYKVGVNFDATERNLGEWTIISE